MNPWDEMFEQFEAGTPQPVATTDNAFHGIPHDRFTSWGALWFTTITGRELAKDDIARFEAALCTIAFSDSAQSGSSIAARLTRVVGSSESGLWSVVVSMVAQRLSRRELPNDIATFFGELEMSKAEIDRVRLLAGLPVPLSEGFFSRDTVATFSPSTIEFDYDAS